MADLKLALDGSPPYDLDLSSGGLEMVTGDDAIVQHLTIRFQLFRGEWFLDRRVGIPYYTDILRKCARIADIRAIFARTITSTPGIGTLDQLDVDLDTTTRALSVTFQATKDDGEILDFSRAFILPGGITEEITA